MSLNIRHINDTLLHMTPPLEAWLIVPIRDQITESVIMPTRKSQMAHMSLQRCTGRQVTLDEYEAQARRGWSYMGAILGHNVAREVTQKIGLLTVVGSAAMVDYLCSLEDNARRKRHMQELSYPATLCQNMLEVLAEYSGLNGTEVATQMTSIVPLVDADRHSLHEFAKTINFRQVLRH